MNIKRIILDIDDVLAAHIESWLSWYNKEWFDFLEKKNITDWNLVQFVSPKCGNRVYDFLKLPTVYDNVLPIEYAQIGVNFLRSTGKEIIFVTSRDWACNKFDWLVRYGFSKNSKEYVVAENKSLIDADMIIDDNYMNVKEFPGIKWLYTQPWNAKYEHPNKLASWGYLSRRVNNWIEIIKLFGGNV
jgi:5'(3')-deoxyribonucleotidase